MHHTLVHRNEFQKSTDFRTGLKIRKPTPIPPSPFPQGMEKGGEKKAAMGDIGAPEGVYAIAKPLRIEFSDGFSRLAS